MYRTLAGLLAVLAASLVLAGLTFSTSLDERADLRFINGVEPETLDPQLLASQAGGRVVTALFEGLTRLDARSLSPAPGAAESWDISDDGLRYTFHLRHGLTWSDGDPLDASDFIYSWRRMLDPALGAEYAYLLHPVRGGRALNTYAGLATTIEDSLLPALAQAAAAAPEAGLSAAAWRELVTRLPLHDSLQHSEDRSVRALLDRPLSASGAPTARRDLDRFISGARDEAARLRQALADIGGRFGESLGIYAPDPRTLVVELEAPTPYFTSLTAFYPMLPVPRQAIERHGDAWFLPEHIVTNGAFELERWHINDRIRLRRSERYWGRAEVHSRTIDVLPTENMTTALNLYLTGEAEWLPSWYPIELALELKKRPDFYAHPQFTVYYYRFNTTRPPLNDARVRHAINLAVDRQLIVDEVMRLGQLPAHHFVPPGIPGYEPPDSAIAYDVQRARELLAAAGFPGGRGFPGIGILYNTSEGHKKVAEVVANQLERNLGIRVTPYNQEWQSYQATTRALDYDMARAAWIGDYLDPNTFLDMWVTSGGNNQTGFSSPAYDAIIRGAANMARFAENPEPLLARLEQPEAVRSLLARRAASDDTNARRDLLDQARMLLMREAEGILVRHEFPIMPVYFYVESGLAVPGLRGFYTELALPDGSRAPNLQGIHPLRDLWVERDGNAPPAATARAGAE